MLKTYPAGVGVRFVQCDETSPDSGGAFSLQVGGPTLARKIGEIVLDGRVGGRVDDYVCPCGSDSHFFMKVAVGIAVPARKSDPHVQRSLCVRIGLGFADK